ncbi:shikimate dehydrogenase family protein [Bartonella sp. HY761]|uniref:shikimate dehydrogenase family protein n=1 Tax=Bartonella sp. HY761 TaxID=2979330 RepID=UPI0021FC551C|nr:shikimate dehydrogenase [Bartonella sp. HY761]UXN06437.1 shikimate dehydrogenase [Bartonella sp. HY761]
MTKLDGSTRLYFVVGDPIAQVQAPVGVTATLQDLGLNAVCVPTNVASQDIATFFNSAKTIKNLDGILVTIPHKISGSQFCDHLSDRSKFLHAVNVVRKDGNGLSGDMVDGLGYIAALNAKGCEFVGKRVLLCGLGGAGSAIAHALVTNGVGELAIFDMDENRQNDNIARLNALGLCRVVKGSRDVSGFDGAINASPAGMRNDDPLPFDVTTLSAHTWAGDVIAKPVETAWIIEAKKRGSTTVLGVDMFAKVRDLVVNFLLAKDTNA